MIAELELGALDRIVAGHADLLRDLERAAQTVDRPSIPSQLIPAKNLVRRRVDAEHELVVSYSRYDPTVLPSALLGALETLTDAPDLAQGRARLIEQGITLDDDLLIQLHRLRVLVRPGEPTKCALQRASSIPDENCVTPGDEDGGPTRRRERPRLPIRPSLPALPGRH